MISPTQEYRVEINAQPVGMLLGFAEHLQRELKFQRGCGSGTVTAIQPAGESYSVQLERLRTDRGDMEDFWNLHNFSLTLISAEGNLFYSGCELMELRLRADEKGRFVEEMRLVARERRVGE